MASARLKVLSGHLKNRSDIEFKQPFNHGALSQNEKIFYEQNGFVIKGGLIEEEILDACRFIDLCEGRLPKGGITLMKDVSLKKKGATGQYLYNKAQEIQYDDVFETYFFHKKLLDVIECFIGPNIKAIHTMLINKPPDSGALTSRHPLHQDLHYFPIRPADLIIAAWTALEDIRLENGCLLVIPGSHKGSLLQHDYPKWEGGVNKIYHGIKDYNENEIIPVEMKKGETIFFHPLLIHGSGVNKTQGFRKAISVHYAASNCYYIDVKGTTQENLALEVEEIAKKRGFQLDIKDIWRAKSRLVRGEEGSL